MVSVEKDNPDERGKGYEKIAETLEEEVDALSFDVEDVLYNAKVLGRGKTQRACRESYSLRAEAEMQQRARVTELP
jgi:uncharacterized protein (UPF0335 family)